MAGTAEWPLELELVGIYFFWYLFYQEQMKNLPFPNRLKFAVNGLVATWKSEASFRFQSVAAVGVLVLLIILRPAPLWWVLLLLTTGSVLSAELLNTALESLIDRIHPDQHRSIKTAKDCAAGAVLIFSLVSVGVLIAFIFEQTSTTR